MTKLYSVHGFADANGKLTTDRLHPYFEKEGYECEAFDYGFHLLVSPFNGRWAKQLAERVEPGSIGVGHSNAAVILAKASLLGAPFSQLVFINPALKRDAEIGKQVKACHVWYSPWDIAVRLGQYLPWSKWGKMGSDGPDGIFPPWIGYNKGAAPFTTRSYTHLDFFLPDKLDYFGPLVANNVRVFEDSLYEVCGETSTH